MFPCPLCPDRTFETALSLEMHSRRKHPAPKKNPARAHACPVEGSSPVKVRPYFCGEPGCNRSYKTRNILGLHVRNKHHKSLTDYEQFDPGLVRDPLRRNPKPVVDILYPALTPDRSVSAVDLLEFLKQEANSLRNTLTAIERMISQSERIVYK